MVVLFHDAESRLCEKTILGLLFIAVATAGICASAAGVGQYPAIISYVFRPNSIEPPEPAFSLTNAWNSASSLPACAQLMSLFASVK